MIIKKPNADYSPWLVCPQTPHIALSIVYEAFMEKLAKAIGIKIRAKRKASNFSQDALALACGIDRSYIGRIERGEVNITIEKLYVIADVLVCEASIFLPSWADLKSL